MPVNGLRFARAIQKVGWVLVRQTGSHMVLRKGERQVVVPAHRSELKQGIYRALLADTGLTDEELRQLL